jgi:hypothetical protein
VRKRRVIGQTKHIIIGALGAPEVASSSNWRWESARQYGEVHRKEDLEGCVCCGGELVGQAVVSWERCVARGVPDAYRQRSLRSLKATGPKQSGGEACAPEARDDDGPRVGAG